MFPQMGMLSWSSELAFAEDADVKLGLFSSHTSKIIAVLRENVAVDPRTVEWFEPVQCLF